MVLALLLLGVIGAIPRQAPCVCGAECIGGKEERKPGTQRWAGSGQCECELACVCPLREKSSRSPCLMSVPTVSFLLLMTRIC